MVTVLRYPPLSVQITTSSKRSVFAIAVTALTIDGTNKVNRDSSTANGMASNAIPVYDGLEALHPDVHFFQLMIVKSCSSSASGSFGVIAVPTVA